MGPVAQRVAPPLCAHARVQAALAALKEEFVRAEEEHAAAMAGLKSAAAASSRGRSAPPLWRLVWRAQAAAGGDAESAVAAAAAASRVNALTETVARLRAEVASLTVSSSSGKGAACPDSLCTHTRSHAPHCCCCRRRSARRRRASRRACGS